LKCCNVDVNIVFEEKVSLFPYKFISYGRCNNCKTYIFESLYETPGGVIKSKRYTNKRAQIEYRKYKKCLIYKDNICYGAFQKISNKKDENGIQVYKQVKKNFDGQTVEDLGIVKTIKYIW